MWNHSLDPYVTKTNLGNERIVVTKFCLPQQRPLCLINAYMPSGHSSKSNAEYRETLDYIHSICENHKDTHYILLASDFNHDLYNRRDPNRKCILKFLEENNLLVYSDGCQYTMFSTCGRFTSHIDLFIGSSNLPCPATATVLEKTPINTSAHTAITIDLNLFMSSKQRSNKGKNQKPAPNKIKWENIDKKLYCEKVQNALVDINLNLVSADTAARLVELAMSNATEVLQPPRKKIASNKKRHRPWNKSVKDAVQKAKVTHILWKDAQKPGKDHPLTIARKKASRSVRAALRVTAATERNKLYTSISTATTRDQQLFHQIIRRHRGGSKSTTIIKVNGQELHDPKDAAEALGDHFRNLATPQSDALFDDALKTRADLDLKTMLPVIEEAAQTSSDITKDQVSKAIKSLNKKKAADTQGITAEHLLYAEKIVSEPIANILSDSKQDNKFPDYLKIGRKIAIPKKGKDSSDPNNNRGISIISQICKTYETVIKQNNDIPKAPHPLQYGFTKGTAPELSALGVTESLAEAKYQKIILYIIALDAQKAFDVVSHPVLFRKLITDGTPRDTIAAIMSIYSNASETVLWEGENSKPYYIKQGVRQGGILSTDLYKMYLDQLLQRLQSTDLGMKIGSTHIAATACADDLILMSPSKHAIQILLDEAVTYAKRHRYKLHPTKSVITAYKDQPPEDIEMYDSPIPTTEKLEHLGIKRQVNNNKPMKSWIEERIALMRRTVHLLMDVGLHGENGLNPVAAVKIIETYVMPRALYGMGAVIISKEDEEKLNQAHRSLLREIQSLPRNTAKEAIYLLSGCLPVSADLDHKRLSLCGMVARMEGNPLNDIAQRQIALGFPNPHSFFTQVAAIGEKYGIDVVDNFANPVEKEAWKKELKTKIKSFHQQELLLSAASKSSLRKLDLLNINQDFPEQHPIWLDCGNDRASIHKSAYRAKMLAGGYLLQFTLAKSSKASPLCQLCGTEDEDMTHFVWRCPALSEARLHDIPKIKESILNLGHVLPASDDEWTATILNGYPITVLSVDTYTCCSFRSRSVTPKVGRVADRRNSLKTRLNKLCSALCNKLHDCRKHKLA